MIWLHMSNIFCKIWWLFLTEYTHFTILFEFNWLFILYILILFIYDSIRIVFFGLNMLIKSIDRIEFFSKISKYVIPTLIALKFRWLFCFHIHFFRLKLLISCRCKIYHFSFQIVSMEICFIVLFMLLWSFEVNITSWTFEIWSGWVMDLHHQSIIKVIKVIL